MKTVEFKQNKYRKWKTSRWKWCPIGLRQ